MDYHDTMKAVVRDGYGSPDALELRDVDKPVVNDDEVLVRIHATSVNPVDWHSLTGTPYVMRVQDGLRRPKNDRLGVDFAGRVEAVGSAVERFRPGDEVFGARNGAFAEYVRVRERRSIVPKPANLTFEQAAAVPVAAVTSLQWLRDTGRMQHRQRVLINGASGGVGTFAVQIAKALGAEVTGVCSTRNVEMVRSIGADHVIDYSREDFTRSGRRYDLMLDIAGNRSWSECKRILEPTGVCVVVGGPKTHRLLGPLTHLVTMRVASVVGSRKAVPFIAKLNKEDLVVLQDLLAAGKVTPVIDRTYPLSEIRDSIRYLGAGHARGKVAITV
jgi:NADPH:quinone reductase-like Zn-dependent oxidoreductase